MNIPRLLQATTFSCMLVCIVPSCSQEITIRERSIEQGDTIIGRADSAAQGNTVKERGTEQWRDRSLENWEGITIRPDSAVMESEGRLGSMPFPKQSTIIVPVVVEAPTPLVHRKLQRSIGTKEIFGFTVQEHRKKFKSDMWVSIDLDYRITFHREHLLQVMYIYGVHGGGASRYGVRERVVDVRTGERLKAEQMFEAAMLPELARRLDDSVQAEIDAATGTDTANIDWRYVDDEGRRKHFTVEDLNSISIDAQGINFIYEFTFPDLFPKEPGEYLIRWEELKPYVSLEGPLAPFVR